MKKRLIPWGDLIFLWIVDLVLWLVLKLFGAAFNITIFSFVSIGLMYCFLLWVYRNFPLGGLWFILVSIVSLGCTIAILFLPKAFFLQRLLSSNRATWAALPGYNFFVSLVAWIKSRDVRKTDCEN